MTKRTTPEKPPTAREASIAGKAMSTGKLTKAETRTLGGRVNSERSAVARKTKKR